MNRNGTVVPLIIANVSIIMHVIMCCYMASSVIYTRLTTRNELRPSEDNDHDSDGDGGYDDKNLYGSDIVFLIILLEIYVAIVSLFLLIGITTKRPRFVTSWLYLTPVYIVPTDLVAFIGIKVKFHWIFILQIFLLIFHVATWKPIKKYLRSMDRVNAQTTENHPLNADNDVASPVTRPQGSSGNAPRMSPPPPGFIHQQMPLPQRTLVRLQLQARQQTTATASASASVTANALETPPPDYASLLRYPVTTSALETPPPAYPNQPPNFATTTALETPPPAYPNEPNYNV